MVDVVLLLSCKDRPGIVAAVASWVASVGGNIVDAQQHTDTHDAMFFQRVQFTPPADVELGDLERMFQRVAEDLGLRYQFCGVQSRPRTAILVSKPLHCLVDLLGRVQLGDLAVDVAAVVSNHCDAERVAGMHGHRFEHLPVAQGPSARADQESKLSVLLDSLSVDLVVLARYMLVLPPALVQRWPGRMINIHHSFLPSFVGANPYRQAHDRGVKLIGATAHYVSEVLDDSPIIAQGVAAVSHRDDVAVLTRRGRDLETTVLSQAVRAHIEHRVLVFGNRTVVFD
jgi:formyltetrahydrofolate deformylase